MRWVEVKAPLEQSLRPSTGTHSCAGRTTIDVGRVETPARIDFDACG